MSTILLGRVCFRHSCPHEPGAGATWIDEPSEGMQPSKLFVVFASWPAHRPAPFLALFSRLLLRSFGLHCASSSGFVQVIAFFGFSRFFVDLLALFCVACSFGVLIGFYAGSAVCLRSCLAFVVFHESIFVFAPSFELWRASMAQP